VMVQGRGTPIMQPLAGGYHSLTLADGSMTKG
jgi:hypothetical protein